MTDGRGHKVQLIFNRTSGRHCSDHLARLQAMLERQGAEVIAFECGPGTEIAISEDATHICAVGGDGTIRHVVAALHKSGRSLPLSIYPAGTINLLHREIGSPTEPALHAEHMLRSDGACSHYAAEVNGELFLACASVGPDSRAVAGLSPRLKRRIGRAAYVAAFVGLLLHWKRETITLRHDCGEAECEAFYVAKGRYFAGAWSFAPDAGLRQPLLHVVALKRARRRDFARFAWALWRGQRPDRLPDVVTFCCTTLIAEAAAPPPVQADGDIVTQLPAQISVRHEPMSFC